MKTVAKLIHQSNMTYIPTNLPVKFFGLPDGKVYLLYARFCIIRPEKTDLEFVIAEHDEFSFDYASEKLVPKAETRYPVYREMVDKPNPVYHILDINRDVKSYAEAVALLNQKAIKMSLHPEAC
ncbi:hypothetical protein [Maribellus sp. YY47]|uniref:hypothetical protein n=1 Tax=Maribellus sp. YY47 TaxID=2929486 RepID=UPI0020006577|nr:hypothetical protein [Maribellus sp. YY47]MCK3685682.1 hypothetical protein [Maribellus sp. YY47]